MKKTNLILVSLVVVILLAGIVLAHTGEDEGIHHEGCGMMGNFGGMMAGNYGMGMGIFGWLISLLIVVVLVLFIVWLIKQIQKK